MVLAWYMDDVEGNQKLEHHCNPPKYITIDELKKLSGVLIWKLDVDRLEEEGKLDKIRKERNYTYSEIIEVSPEKLPNYDEKVKMFYKEHFHAHEEIRLVLEGSGYSDVRDVNDKWIRIFVEKGDLYVLPAGMYHRFTLDTKNYIKAMLLFVRDSGREAIFRPADDHEARKAYLKLKDNGFEE